jgi:hypothetical protein
MLQVATSLEGGRWVVEGHGTGLGPRSSLIGMGKARRRRWCYGGAGLEVVYLVFGCGPGAGEFSVGILGIVGV